MILWALLTISQAREIGEPFALTLRGGGQIVLQKSENGFKFEGSNLNCADEQSPSLRPGLATPEPSASVTRPTTRTKFIDSNLKSGAGKTPVLFAFFNTWCPPCRAEIPLFNDLAERYAGRVIVVGVLLEEKSASFMEKWIKMHKPRYEIATSGGVEFAGELGDVIGTPYTLLLAPSGEIVAKYLGHTDKDTLEAKIKELVK